MALQQQQQGQEHARQAEIEHGPRGVAQVGHRRYVGGLFEEIGRLQFEFLVARGLRPEHRYIDVACGCLRGGVHVIPYLNAGHYMGIEKEEALIEAGLRDELPAGLAEEKKPRLVVSAEFEFERFAAKADFALAQSLFTHLPPSLIERCMARLRPAMAEGGVFFATFFEVAEPTENPEAPHDHLCFRYTRQEMERMGERSGWRGEYIGEWRHPRRQMMMRYEPAL